jgi:hypothetical protein
MFTNAARILEFVRMKLLASYGGGEKSLATTGEIDHHAWKNTSILFHSALKMMEDSVPKSPLPVFDTLFTEDDGKGTEQGELGEGKSRKHTREEDDGDNGPSKKQHM